MIDEAYTDTVIEHFMCPRNVGIMNDPNGVGNFGDPACGDFLTIYIRVENDIIEDISFLVVGCPAAVATSSMTTVLTKGKSLEEASLLTNDNIAEALGGLSESKKHCSNLGMNALKNAISDYLENN